MGHFAKKGRGGTTQQAPNCPVFYVEGLRTKKGNKIPMFFDYEDAKRCFMESGGGKGENMDMEIFELVDLVVAMDKEAEAEGDDAGIEGIQQIVFIPEKKGVEFAKVVEMKGKGRARLKNMVPNQKLF